MERPPLGRPFASEGGGQPRLARGKGGGGDRPFDLWRGGEIQEWAADVADQECLGPVEGASQVGGVG